MCIDVASESGCKEPKGAGIDWQRDINLIELVMFIVIISVSETGMRINPQPRNLTGILQ